MKHKSPVPSRIKEARTRAGLSQKELGIKAGIDEFSASPRINQYERGKHEPNYATLATLAQVLGVPVTFFFAPDDNLAELILIYNTLSPSERRALLRRLKEE